MKKHNRLLIPSALLALALAGGTALAQTVTNIVPRPMAMQPGGDPTDTTRNFGQFWTDNGVVSQDIDTTMRSTETIPASLHVIMDCPGGTVTPLKSANLAYGNFFLSKWGDNGWLGAGYEVDASKYESLTFDLYINNAASSNTAIPLVLYGSGYQNVSLTNLPLTLTNWHHIVVPIPPTINLPNCVAYGVYNWYNTTASTPPAHVEYWMDNVTFVARAQPPAPPTVSLKPVTELGLLFDSAPGEGGQRGSIATVSDVRWAGTAAGSPITYAMTIDRIPDPTVYSNYEARLLLVPDPGLANNGDWNASDMGYLQIHSRNDGTAIARMMWKTNDAMDNAMLFNDQPGGQYGTNGFPVGTLGYLVAPSMTGSWSLTFTSDTGFTLRGPGGVSTNLTLPAAWLERYNTIDTAGALYVSFGGGPNGNANSGHSMVFSKVAVSYYGYTNDFSSATLDTGTWRLTGNEIAIVTPASKWWANMSLPATDFGLWVRKDMNTGTAWMPLSGNTNLSIPVTSYDWGTNRKTLVAGAVLPGTKENYFAARKLAVAKLQVLLPGELNAPFTATGKTGTPDAQSAGNVVTVRVNAVDADWNVVSTCTDTIHITSSDTGAALPPDAALVGGTGTFDVVFGTAGPQTVTASDMTQTSVAAGVSTPLPIP